jgi:hypothetical protein
MLLVGTQMNGSDVRARGGVHEQREGSRRQTDSDGTVMQGFIIQVQAESRAARRLAYLNLAAM